MRSIANNRKGEKVPEAGVRSRNHAFLLKAGIVLLAIVVCSLQAKTRWSALHFVPDADFLMGGQFVVDGEGYYFSDTAAKATVNAGALATIGIIEWVNIEGGYCGGPTIGFKARILGESGDYVPSIALGVHNILTNREAGLFSRKDTLTNEVYLAFGKSIEPLRMRIHLGLQTIPKSNKDQLNPYIALEEYFGNGLYASIEVFRRQQEFHPSLFVSYRFLKKRLEVAVGAVRINRLFFDQNNQFKVALGNKGTDEFVKPGIWFGLRYSGSLGFGKKGAFTTVEDQVSHQDKTIRSLSMTVDSLKLMVTETRRRMYDVNSTLMKMTDSMSMDKSRMKPILIEKITTLKSLYAEEPFEPERVRRAINEIVALRENALPGLREILLDRSLDKRTRVLTVMLLGNIGNAGASDILLDVLSQTQDPDIKIEICIALGKIKETRAEYVLEQLANDPVDAVAFTAQEVLLKLTRETGMKVSPDVKMRKITIPEPSSIVDAKIKTRTAVDTSKPGAGAQGGKGADSGFAKAAVPEIAKKSVGGRDQAAGQDVWDVGHPADSASVQTPPKDSAQARAKTELNPAKPDSSHVAKLDSLLTSTAKDKKASDKKSGAKKKNNVAKEKNNTDEPENKSW